MTAPRGAPAWYIDHFRAFGYAREDLEQRWADLSEAARDTYRTTLEVGVLADLIAKAHPFWADKARGLHVCIAKDILASDWLAAREAAAEARGAERALREAADRWTQGAWSDVMLPQPTPPAVPVIAYSNRVGDWLRARAAAAAAGGGA